VTGVHVNQQSWPLLMLTPRAGLGETGMVQSLSGLDALARKTAGPYVQIWDLRGVGSLGEVQRALVQDLCDTHRQDGLLAGCAVIPGATGEALWADAPVLPVGSFDGMRDAMRWASALLDEVRDAPVPDSVRSLGTQQIPAISEETGDSLERAPNPGEIVLRAEGSGRSTSGFTTLMKLRWKEHVSWLAPADDEHPDPVTWTGPFGDLAAAEALRNELAAAGIALIIETWPE
jgi:hypothetical protein